MSSEGSDGSAFLARLDAVLAQDPKSQSDAIRLLLEEIKGFQSKANLTVVEQGFEKLGTTVGKESRSLSMNYFQIHGAD